MIALMYFWQAWLADLNVSELVSRPDTEKERPFPVGSAKLVTPWDRIQCAYSKSELLGPPELLDPPVEADPIVVLDTFDPPDLVGPAPQAAKPTHKTKTPASSVGVRRKEYCLEIGLTLRSIAEVFASLDSNRTLLSFSPGQPGPCRSTRFRLGVLRAALQWIFDIWLCPFVSIG